MRWGSGCGSFRAGIPGLSGVFTLTLRRCLGRRETREHSRHYLQAPAGAVRGAAQRRESVPRTVSGVQPGGCSGFLTDSPWGRCSDYRTPAGIPGIPAGTSGGGVGCWDGSDFPKQGRKSVGVARQYCGRTGGRWPTARPECFLAYVQSLGAGPGGQRALSAGELDLG